MNKNKIKRLIGLPAPGKRTAWEEKIKQHLEFGWNVNNGRFRW